MDVVSADKLTCGVLVKGSQEGKLFLNHSECDVIIVAIPSMYIIPLQQQCEFGKEFRMFHATDSRYKVDSNSIIFTLNVCTRPLWPQQTCMCSSHTVLTQLNPQAEYTQLSSHTSLLIISCIHCLTVIIPQAGSKCKWSCRVNSILP